MDQKINDGLLVLLFLLARKKMGTETQNNTPNHTCLPSNPKKMFEPLDTSETAKSDTFVVVVPFRASTPTDPRNHHLVEFKRFVRECLPHARVYVIHQTPGKKFNRGVLLNVGFLQAYKECRDVTHVVTHDVDLIPSAELVDLYKCVPPPRSVIHFARRFERYAGDLEKNPEYIGGVVSVRTEDFLDLNGYPNLFWGWGGEDDELSRRIRTAGMRLLAPTCGSYTDLEGLTIKQKVAVLQRGTERCMTKHELLGEYATGSLPDDGLRSLNPTKVRGVARTTDGACTEITIELLASNGHPSDLCSDESYSTWGYVVGKSP